LLGTKGYVVVVVVVDWVQKKRGKTNAKQCNPGRQNSQMNPVTGSQMSIVVPLFWNKSICSIFSLISEY
jgi:hypothetical protein